MAREGERVEWLERGRGWSGWGGGESGVAREKERVEWLGRGEGWSG